MSWSERLGWDDRPLRYFELEGLMIRIWSVCLIAALLLHPWVLASQEVDASPQITIRPGTPVTIDGVRAPGEWDDASSLHLETGEGRYTVYYKRDRDGLLLAFAGFTGSPIRVPEVLIDADNRKGPEWSSSTWWFHASATDCWNAGRPNAYSTCVAQAGVWEANNMADFSTPPEIMEMRIPLDLLGLDPAAETEIGIAFHVTDTSSVWEFWPDSAALQKPSTWATATVKEY